MADGDGNLKDEEFNEYQAMVQKKRATNEIRVHVPKTSMQKIDKIILFGHIYHGKSEEEALLYQFTHQRMNGVITEGYIPIGFLSSVTVQNIILFLAVRKAECGPEFQISMRTPNEVVADWDLNPDAMWSSVLSYFDKKAIFSDSILDYLDADPFVLFGIDDPITQRALRKLEKQPVLLSRGDRPDIMEWNDYLSGRTGGQKRNQEYLKDVKTRWVIQAFAETELPSPWTSYKGIGNIVCFMNHETGTCSWKHPFYEYFNQLWNYCMTADPLDVKRIRTNRLIWNYEASQQSGVIQQPLVSPEYIEQLSETMGYNVSDEPYLVRTLKAALKSLSRKYRLNMDIPKEDIAALLERLQLDGQKQKVMLNTWQNVLSSNVTFDIELLTNGEINCIDCENAAQSFCLECKDYFCIKCFEKLHAKGHRKTHIPFRLIPCTMCTLVPAKVHCTFTDKSFCHECYCMKHVTQLPHDARESAPKKINYAKQSSNIIKQHQAQQFQTHAQAQRDDNYSEKGSCNSVLTADWHQFFDGKGIKYYYNFRTGEHILHSPTQTPQQSITPSEIDEDEDGPISLPTSPAPRTIRAPFRSHPDAYAFKDLDRTEMINDLVKGQQKPISQ